MHMIIKSFCAFLIIHGSIEYAQCIGGGARCNDMNDPKCLLRTAVPECNPLNASNCYLEAANAFKPFSKYALILYKNLTFASTVMSGKLMDELMVNQSVPIEYLGLDKSISVEEVYTDADISQFQSDACDLYSHDDKIRDMQLCSNFYSGHCNFFKRSMVTFHEHFDLGIKALCDSECKTDFVNRVESINTANRKVQMLVDEVKGGGFLAMKALRNFMCFCGINHPYCKSANGNDKKDEKATDLNDKEDEGETNFELSNLDLCQYRMLIANKTGKCKILGPFSVPYKDTLQVCARLNKQLGGKPGGLVSLCEEKYGENSVDNRIDDSEPTDSHKRAHVAGWHTVEFDPDNIEILRQEMNYTDDSIGGNKSGKDTGSAKNSEESTDNDLDKSNEKVNTGRPRPNGSTVRKNSRHTRRKQNRQTRRKPGIRPDQVTRPPPKDKNDSKGEDPRVFAAECAAKHVDTMRLFAQAMQANGNDYKYRPNRGNRDEDRKKKESSRNQGGIGSNSLTGSGKHGGKNQSGGKGSEEGTTTEKPKIPDLDPNDPCRELMPEVWQYYSIGPASTTPRPRPTTIPDPSASPDPNATPKPTAPEPEYSTVSPKPTEFVQVTNDPCDLGQTRWTYFRQCLKKFSDDLRSARDNEGCNALEALALCREEQIGTCEKLKEREDSMYSKNTGTVATMNEQLSACHMRQNLGLWNYDPGSSDAWKEFKNVLANY